jgi:hypothetical protein
MEAVLGTCLYNYPYLKIAKMLCLSYHCLCILFNEIGEESRTVSTLKQGEWGEKEREMAQKNACKYEKND